MPYHTQFDNPAGRVVVRERGELFPGAAIPNLQKPSCIPHDLEKRSRAKGLILLIPYFLFILPSASRAVVDRFIAQVSAGIGNVPKGVLVVRDAIINAKGYLCGETLFHELHHVPVTEPDSPVL